MNLLLLSLGLGALKDFIPDKATIGFVPTAGEPYEDPYFVRDDRNRLLRLGYDVRDIDISQISRLDLSSILEGINALFIAGGNTFYLMQQIRQRDMADDLRRYILSDRPYIGASAGAVICGPTLEPIGTLDDPGAAPLLKNLAGLEVVNFVVLPHYGKEKYLDKYHAILKEYTGRLHLVPLRDDEALRVSAADHYTLVSSPMVLHEAKSDTENKP